MNKRVLLLYVGGVDFPQAYSPEHAEETLRGYLELQLISNVTIEIVTNTAGADMTWENLVLLGERIVARYNDFDGFVVLHGIDNAIYSSTFLRYIFKEIGKPVVFTGASLPDSGQNFAEPLDPKERRTYREIGVRTNLVTAVQLATLDTSGMYLAYGSRIVRSVRALEQTMGETHWFHSLKEEDVARVQFGVQLTPAAPARTSDAPIFDPRFNPNILTLPSLPSVALPNLKNTAAIIMRGYEEQIIPSVLHYPTDIPIIVYSKTFAVTKQADNIIVVPNATYQTLYTKTLTTLAQTASLAEFLEAFKSNTFGEFY